MASASKKTSACPHHGGSLPPPKLVSAAPDTVAVWSDADDQRASKVSLESVIRPVDSFPDNTAKKPANKGISVMPRTETKHPLDPLSAAEISVAVATVRAAGANPEVRDGMRFIEVASVEPDKQVVALADAYFFPPFQPSLLPRTKSGPVIPMKLPPRRARLVVYNQKSNETSVWIVALSEVHAVTRGGHHRGRVVSSQVIPDVQPPMDAAEYAECEAIVKDFPPFIEAMKRRGIEDMDLVMVDPWCVGYHSEADAPSRRLAKPLIYCRTDSDSPMENGYARPVEGIYVLVDMQNMVVIEFEDRKFVPLPPPDPLRNYTPGESRGGVDRSDVKPLQIIQPEGPSFRVRGYFVEWQKWNFRIGFTPREGLVIHSVAYVDGSRGRRPVAHRLSFVEMVVPYGDPNEPHYRKNAFDAGEDGLGKNAHSLKKGCDCLGSIKYFDAHFTNFTGGVETIENCVCLHEEDHGILWKHQDWRTGLAEVRRSMDSDVRRKINNTTQGSSPSPKPSKFSVYRNPALAAASTANSIRPSKSVLLFIFLLSIASAFSLISFMAGEKWLTNALTFGKISQEAAYVTVKAWQGLVTLFCIGAMMALSKGISLHRAKFAARGETKSFSKETKDQFSLSNRQLELLGIKKKADQSVSEFPKSRPALKPAQSLEPLVPIHHQTLTGSAHKSSGGGDKLNSRNGSQISSFSTPSKQMGSPSMYLVPSSSPVSSNRLSSGQDKAVSSPWSGRRSSAKDITTEEQLEQLLAEIDEKITESAGKMRTPPPTVGSFAMASPSTVGGSTGASGATRSTPLRPVRMSPGAQKFTTPPKKGEGDFPNPMSLERAIEGFIHLGVYPQIEDWRDRLRQWCSSVLLKPLLNKVETSHIQVMQTASKLGVNVTVSQVGSDLPTNGTATTALPVDRTKGWQPSYSLDEDALLHQLRANLVQAIDASMQKLRTENQQFQQQQQQQQQQAALIPVMQECVDAISEHRRLQGLMKGEWVKGLLPRSSIPADYTVQRIRALAEGTCVKNYEYNGGADTREKNKKWSLEPPTDSHLLLYLFCAFLEHPKWMLHLDPSSYTGTQASKNPLFLGVLPPKERFPEKYIAVVSGVPSTLHPGACVLAVDKQSPPTFALYWDKKVQFTLQGRTALWDSMLLICHRIKVGYGGVVRGMNLGSSALNILQVVDSDTDD